MSSEARPITLAAFAAALTDLPVENLYAKAFELNNSVAHLERSNTQLKEYSDSIRNDTSLAENVRRGGDRDCEDAIKENDVVIARQRERIGLLRAEVERRGGRWHEAGGEEGVNGHADEDEGATGRAPGGRLTDEELRRRMEERMGADEDDDEDVSGTSLRSSQRSKTVIRFIAMASTSGAACFTTLPAEIKLRIYQFYFAGAHLKFTDDHWKTGHSRRMTFQLGITPPAIDPSMDNRPGTHLADGECLVNERLKGPPDVSCVGGFQNPSWHEINEYITQLATNILLPKDFFPALFQNTLFMFTDLSALLQARSMWNDGGPGCSYQGVSISPLAYITKLQFYPKGVNFMKALEVIREIPQLKILSLCFYNRRAIFKVGLVPKAEFILALVLGTQWKLRKIYITAQAPHAQGKDHVSALEYVLQRHILRNVDGEDTSTFRLDEGLENSSVAVRKQTIESRVIEGMREYLDRRGKKYHPDEIANGN